MRFTGKIGVHQIARTLGIGRNTVRRFLACRGVS